MNNYRYRWQIRDPKQSSCNFSFCVCVNHCNSERNSSTCLAHNSHVRRCKCGMKNSDRSTVNLHFSIFFLS